jgi:hypothetical protein
MDQARYEKNALTDSKEEGRDEKNIEVVIDSHKIGLSVDTIAAITRQTPEQVTDILNEHGLI